MDGNNGEIQFITKRKKEGKKKKTLEDRATVYAVEVSTKKSKIMTNSTNNIRADISMNGQYYKEVTSFTYLGPPCARTAPA